MVRAETQSAFRASIEELKAQFDRPSSSFLTEESAIDTDRGWEDAIDGYVSASLDVFAEAKASEAPVALASLGGDFRVLAELEAHDPDAERRLVAQDDGEAAEGGPAESVFSADMGEVTAVVAGEPLGSQVFALADDGVPDPDPLESILKSIDEISSTGRTNLVKAAATAAAVTSTGNLVDAVGRLFGADAATAFSGVIASLGGWLNKIKRAAAKILDAIMTKVTSLLGGPAARQLQDWLDKLVTPAAVYDDLMQIPAIKKYAQDTIPTDRSADAHASQIAAVAAHHDQTQKWVAWGAMGLGWGGHLLKAVAPPFGALGVTVAAAALVLLCVWLTADVLDSYAWLPAGTLGVRSILGCA